MKFHVHKTEVLWETDIHSNKYNNLMSCGVVGHCCQRGATFMCYISFSYFYEFVPLQLNLI